MKKPLLVRLQEAERNVRDARMFGNVGHLAGWEHQVIGEAIAELARLTGEGRPVRPHRSGGGNPQTTRDR